MKIIYKLDVGITFPYFDTKWEKKYFVEKLVNIRLSQFLSNSLKGIFVVYALPNNIFCNMTERVQYNTGCN